MLLKRYGPKAAFGKTSSLFDNNYKSLEKLAYQGHLAARMGLITTCYLQQAVGNLLDNLEAGKPNLDSAIQNVRDIFALSTKTLDQMARTGSFHHMIRRRATMYDTRLSDLKEYANTIVTLPLTSDGIFGNQFDIKLKEKTERNKQLPEVFPDIKPAGGARSFKRKAPSTGTSDNSDGYAKKSKYDISFKIPKKAPGDYKSQGKQLNNKAPANKTWVSSFLGPKKKYSS